MSRNTNKLTRLAALGLSACILLPATATAMPIRDGQTAAQPVQGQSVAAGGGSGVTVATLTSPAQTGGGDVVSGGGYQIPAAQTAGPPVFPTNTKSLPRPAAATPSDGGIDTGILIALGVGILVALGATFVVVATRPRTRERQAA